jgi:hypothetical protein
MIRTMKVLMAVLLFVSCSCYAEETLKPGGKTEYEKRLQELNAKYGSPDSNTLRQQVMKNENGAAPTTATTSSTATKPSTPVPPAAQTSVTTGGKTTTTAGKTSITVDPSLPVPGTKIQIELFPAAHGQFKFAGRNIDEQTLREDLVRLKRDYVIDGMILHDMGDVPLDASHLLAFGRLSSAAKIAGIFERGGKWEPIAIP